MASVSGAVIGATLILQSHRRPLPALWLEPCLASVRAWAERAGFLYRFEDDELLRRLDAGLSARTLHQPVVAADLARLAALQDALREGFETVVWLDADTLVLSPDAFTLPHETYALGREVWIQRDAGGLKAYVKVHNAFLLFRQGNPFLEFYRHAAERIVMAHTGAMVPQLVGPKLLTVLHNLVSCPVAERAGMLCPAVAADVLTGSGPALDAFRKHSAVAPAAVNLCASLVGREIGERDVRPLIDRLLETPEVLEP